MKRTMSLALMLSWILSAEAKACSCMEMGRNFFETMAMEISRQNPSIPEAPTNPVVVLGKVTRYLPFLGRDFPTEMEVQVEYVLHGDAKSRTIVVEGDNGALCRPYVSRFNVGSTYVLGLRKLGGSDRYDISICGHYWMEAKQPLEQN